MVNLLAEMKKNGYHVERIPSSGNEVVEELLAGVSNDTEWLSAEQMVEQASGLVEKDIYRQWFEKIPATCQEVMCRDWGTPPGEMFEVDGKLVIPGVKNGNVFIGIQPPRGFLEQVETLYHNTDLVMPHHYLAYYRYLAEDLGVQAVIHMGTHGTLEWLPGKAVGLSGECFPDVVLGEIPHLYPYIIDNPGEGIQAKRRSCAVILDHLVPAMNRADSYAEVADLDMNLQEYFRSSRSGETGKAEQVLESIYEIVKEHNYLNDLGLPEEADIQMLAKRVEDLYDYICEFRDNLIKDGLHIFGRPPTDERFAEMVYSLSRLCNGLVPSLRESIASYKGLDLRDLQDDPSGSHEGTGVLKGTLLEDVDERSRLLIHEMDIQNYEHEECVQYTRSLYPNGSEIEMAVSHICEVIAPNLRLTTDEVMNCLRGMDGGYVPPGPSGSPSRGNSHLLPTGRNFYSIDPSLIPTPAAWEVGHKLADQMVNRHIDEEGGYPENVGIIVFATDTMKTGGDDIAYILWLMGLRPVWSSAGGRITKLEVIPIEELGRPRIDVTLRISGLFRDAFPNLVEMIDEGVEMVASLDESEDENYYVRHLLEELLESIKSGMSEEEAREKALIRIFGCPPGTYGAGVDQLVESSRWTEREELAEMYVQWGGHAYGRKLKGKKMPELFTQRLADLDVTIKNHNSREIDILDNDDDYIYHGGMVAAVKSFGEKDPLSVVGDSSDPDRPKTRTTQEEGRFIFRSRILNPKWLNGLKEHGYRGAQELSILVDYAFGWDATSDMLDPWMYQSLADHFLFDEETRKWIEENNPYAMRQMAGRLLEAIQRGMWDADDDTIEKLQSIYLDAEDILEGFTED